MEQGALTIPRTQRLRAAHAVATAGYQMRLGAAGLAIEVFSDARVLIGVALMVRDVRRGLAGDDAWLGRSVRPLVPFMWQREFRVLLVVGHSRVGDGAGRFVFFDVRPRGIRR